MTGRRRPSACLAGATCGADRLTAAPTACPGADATLGAAAYRLVRALASCALAASMAACGTPPAPLAQLGSAPTHTIRIVSHGWHTGLVLRADDVTASVWPVKNDFPDARAFEIGWGDRGFYMAHEPGAWLALRAIAWPSPGVLHVVALDRPFEHAFAGAEAAGAEVLDVGITGAGLRALLERLRASHQLDPEGRAVPLGAGLYGQSRFYASRERFHLLRTCNVWTATLLHAAGVPVNPARAVTAGQLLDQLRALPLTRSADAAR